MMFRLLAWGLLVASALPSAAWPADPEVVATVNGEPVARAELQQLLADTVARERLEQELRLPMPAASALHQLAVQKLIHRRLFLQEAARRSMTVDEAELDGAVEGLRRRFQDLRSFGAWLHARSLDDRSLFEMVRMHLLTTRVQEALLEGVGVTEGEMRAYYHTHRQYFEAGGRVRLRVIAVKDKDSAEGIMTALRDGADFADLARRRSLGLRAALGGEIGWVSPEHLPPPLRDAVAALNAGEVSAPLEKTGEFLIVRLEERRPARTKTLEEARPDIEQRLLSQRQREVLQAWLAEQEKASKVEILMPAAGNQ
jgi:foldase protein PrsA